MLATEKQPRISPDLKNILKASICLFRKRANLEYIYDLEDSLRYSKASSTAVEWLKNQPEIAKLIQERYIAPKPDIGKLLEYPEDTLGYAYASHMKNSGLDPGFYRQMKLEDDISYVLLRIRQSHDIWHIVTGFGTDISGELELKAFEAAQTRRTLAFVLIGIAFINRSVQFPESIPDMFKKIISAYQMGLQAKPLFAQKWEEHFDKPLSEWRNQLGIELVSVDRN